MRSKMRFENEEADSSRIWEWQQKKLCPLRASALTSVLLGAADQLTQTLFIYYPLSPQPWTPTPELWIAVHSSGHTNYHSY